MGHTAVVFGNKLWIIGGNGKNDVWYSTDGASWSAATDSAGFLPREGHAAAVFNNQLWVIGGKGSDTTSFNDAWYSIDGTAWQEASAFCGFSPRFSPGAAVFLNKLWIIGGVYFNGNYLYYNDIWYLQ
jgi:N-acetylneuraminic acid mutarotase